MHIVHVLGYLGTEFGGVNAAVLDLAEAQRNLGYEAKIVAAAPQGVPHPSRSYVSSFPMRGPAELKYAPSLYRHLATCPAPDVIHIHGFWHISAWAASRTALRRRVPYVLSPHGVLSQWSLGHHKARKAIYLRLRGRRVLQDSHAAFALTASEERRLRDLGHGGSIVVVPNGVTLPGELDRLHAREHADTRWPNLQGKRVVLLLSRLSREKGLDILIPAWRSFLEEHRDWTLVIAGQGDARSTRHVGELVRVNKLSANIQLTGLVEGIDKASLLERADFFVLPSRSEGFSMSVLENLSCGTPGIVSDACNFPEVESAGAGYIIQPTVSDVTDALYRLAQLTAAELTEMSHQAQRLASAYSWPSVATRSVQGYEEALRRGT